MKKPNAPQQPNGSGPKLQLGFALLAGLLLGLAGIAVSIVATLYPTARPYLWVLFAICVGGIVGLITFYIMERSRLTQSRAVLYVSCSASVAGALLALMVATLLEDRGPPDFSTVPAQHGSLRVSFFGASRFPQLLDGENLYKPNFSCTLVQADTAPGPNGPWTNTGATETCTIFIVWKRPIDVDKVTVTMDGKSFMLAPPTRNEFYSPYISVLTLNGIPPVGVVTISADAKA